MSNYAIFHCRLTLELMREYGETYGVVVPVQHARKFNQRKELVTEHDYAAIPGFAFVPLSNAAEIRRRIPETYNLRQLYYPTGNPCVIQAKEIEDLQRRLDREFVSEYTFKVGEKVKVNFTIVHGAVATGTIVKFRSCGKARVKLDKLHSFVEVPQFLLSKPA